MERRKFIRNAVTTLGILALLNKDSLALFIKNEAYNVKMITPTVGIFTESGGTILFAITNKGIVVVDSQFPDNANHLIKEIKLLSSKKFALLVNTHHHADHTAGNIAFKEIVQNVVAHTNSLANQIDAAKKSNKEAVQLYPSITFKTTFKKKLGNEKMSIYHLGDGHTNGDSFVYFKKSNVVHVGDLVFNRMHPYIDKSHGANISKWIITLTNALQIFGKDANYVCGHCAKGYSTIISHAEVSLFINYLTNLISFTKAKIAEGVTKEIFLTYTTIPGSPEWVSDGIKRPLEAAWLECKEEKF